MQLVKAAISIDSIEAIEQIRQGFLEGHYIGAVVGLIRPRMRYTVHCIGMACRNPTFSRGVTAAIDDELRDMIHGDGGGQDTVF